MPSSHVFYFGLKGVVTRINLGSLEKKVKEEAENLKLIEGMMGLSENLDEGKQCLINVNKIMDNISRISPLKKEMEKRGMKCKCIRCREVGFAIRSGINVDLKELKLEKISYRANCGDEIFLSFVNKDDVLFAICRLRLPDDGKIAYIRELHVYGPEVEIERVEENKIQHKGLGRKLLSEAEKIAEENGYKILKIISGVGVREYYRKQGYKLDEEGYVEKEL